MSRWWVTTRFGDRVDAAHAFWVQHRFADGREHEMPDRHLLELVWEDRSETLAVFLDRSDCIRALDAFVRQGWVRGEPDVYMCEGRAVNPARIRACRAETSDAGQTWRAQLDVATGAIPQPIAVGLTREQAVRRVLELTEQLESRQPACWVDPDFTRSAWRTVTAAEDGWLV